MSLAPLVATVRACLYTLSLLLGGCGVVAVYGVTRGNAGTAIWAVVLLGLAAAINAVQERIAR